MLLPGRQCITPAVIVGRSRAEKVEEIHVRCRRGFGAAPLCLCASVVKRPAPGLQERAGHGGVAEVPCAAVRNICRALRDERSGPGVAGSGRFAP